MNIEKPRKYRVLNKIKKTILILLMMGGLLFAASISAQSFGYENEINAFLKNLPVPLQYILIGLILAYCISELIYYIIFPFLELEKKNKLLKR